MGEMQPSEPHETPIAEGLSAFLSVRPRLFGIAYRILGTAAEAEDVVQEVWLRWQGADRSVVKDAEAFLATTATRLAINVAQSARLRRETYVGPWLPEPVDTESDPTLGAERGEALGFAVLMLMEKLTPTERAAYVLREAFDYDYGRIAEVLQGSEANARQLVTRARRHVTEERRAPVSGAEQERLLRAFIDAAQRGDTAELESMLAADVVSYSDGGGAARASRTPVVGRERVAKFLTAVAKHFWVGAEMKWRNMNGQPSVLILQGGQPLALATLEATAEGIGQILWVMNPAKLTIFG